MAAPQQKPAKQGRTTRRKFLLGTVVLLGGGLGLRWMTRTEPRLSNQPGVLEPNAFLQITPDGQFIFQLDRVEMGQGTMTGLATLVAEELDLDPARLDVQFAPVLSTFQRPVQLTGQSRSLLDSWEILRETGATARAMLLEAAAQRWQTDKRNLRTDDGVVFNERNGQQLAYRELAASAAQMSVPWNVKLKAPENYRWIGKHVPRLDARDKVTGAAGYGMDVQLENMLTAVIARCPELGVVITGYDTADAANMPGVKGFVELANGIAVVATDYWSAQQAALKVQLEWDAGPLADQTDGKILEAQRSRFDSTVADYEYERGNDKAASSGAAAEVAAEYITPYLAHATMEPMNATAHVGADFCELWIPTQAPDLSRQAACDVTGLTRAQVNVHTTYIGGGFGRRVLCDFVTEAVQIAREFEQPVKLVWPREADMQHGYYRQQTVHRLTGKLDAEQRILWWDHRQVAAGTGDVLTPPAVASLLPEPIPAARRAEFSNWLGRKTIDWMGAFQAREGAKDLPYAIPDRRFAQHTYNPGMPIAIWRSVGNSYNAFVVESFIDEMAVLAQQDPLEYRRSYLHEQPEFLTVLNKLEQVAAWGSPENGRYQGVAIFKAFGTIVGQVAEVSVAPSNSKSKTIRVHKVTCVVDCGFVVNPDIVRAQMESGIIFGLTAALYGEINMESGRVRQSNFHDYRMVRMADAPYIDTHIIATDREPAGVGEPGTPVIAPAVANAVYAATGQRLRRLPLTLAG